MKPPHQIVQSSLRNGSLRQGYTTAAGMLSVDPYSTFSIIASHYIWIGANKTHSTRITIRKFTSR